MDDPWIEAIAEAYASKPAHVRFLEPLELRRPAPVDEDSDAGGPPPTREG